MSAVKSLFPLTEAQLAAVIPHAQVWLRASAGTGKTQVLTARVLRLLLCEDVRPENLLCITFTKAGAAEMAERINGLLARWVQCKGTEIASDLMAIGADHGPENQRRARTLFASVLDAPGGGLQIMTIHSLAQSLLGSFPEEAGLVPGFKPVEGREQDELLKECLAELILEYEEHGNKEGIRDIQGLGKALGEDGALNFLKKCAGEHAAMLSVPDGASVRQYARRLVGIQFEGSAEEFLEAALGDDAIDRKGIEGLANQNLAWNSKVGSRGAKRAEAIRDWLALNAAGRAQKFDGLRHCWTKDNGEPLNASKGYTPLDESYSELALSLYHWTRSLHEQVKLIDYAGRLVPALQAGRAFALRYASAKKARGLIDYDDMIQKTAGLLKQRGMGDWIRYKLDQRIDHILVDESQDTNRAQWEIVEALADDFFSGSGAKGEDRNRSLFSVGDEKQAIFGFQGTDPLEYKEAGERFAEKVAQLGGEMEFISLDRSFRSTTPVLAAVNSVFGHLGPDDLGEIAPFRQHFSELGEYGSVELLLPVTTDLVPPDASENWIADEKRILAARIAERVAELVDNAPYLHGKERQLKAGDIMILLRSRGELASLLVAQLHQREVKVAGIDRLKLREPLVVQDLLAAVRFVLQPDDNFSLACLLVSPLIGWSQEKLLEYGYREPGKCLWDHLRNQPEITADLQPLFEMLSMADYTTAYAFLEQILSGPIRGRAKFIGRLGAEAAIPMEEMLNLALQFDQQGGSSLQAFLHWFESDDSDITREMLPDSEEVRVMTVHGAKGLQAPVVILADITSDPEKKPDHSASLKLDAGELPLLNIRKEERFGRLAAVVDMQKRREQQEHLRLLYVAMTRAEEYLIMAGSLSDSRKDKGAPESSWYPRIEQGLVALGCEWQDDDLFARKLRHRPMRQGAQPGKKGASKASVMDTGMPEWISLPAPQEERPPRPLVPSQIEIDDFGDAPGGQAMQAAAERGRLLHMMFERMGGGDLHAQLRNARSWIMRQNASGEIDVDDILGELATILNEPGYADWFGPDARSEVPVAAIVGQHVITGRIDRLLVTEKEVAFLDFKTGRTVPNDASGVPAAFLRQMAHYAAALEVIFPGRPVRAAILYTHMPHLIALGPDILSAYRPQA